MPNVQYGGRPLFTPGKIYLFGDVHNEADNLMDVLDQIEPLLKPEDHIVFCGDLIDRGREPAMTIDTLISLAKRYPTQVVFVEGNHDWMLRNYLETGSTQWLPWLKTTLLGLQNDWALPDIMPKTIAEALVHKGYKEITSRTVPYYETEEVIATHAPLDLIICMMNGVQDYEQDWVAENGSPSFIHLLDRMLNELKWQFTDESREIQWIKKFRVCGHQAGTLSHPRIFKDRAFIDTGCGLRANGKLTCLVYPGKKFFQSRL